MEPFFCTTILVPVLSFFSVLLLYIWQETQKTVEKKNDKSLGQRETQLKDKWLENHRLAATLRGRDRGRRRASLQEEIKNQYICIYILPRRRSKEAGRRRPQRKTQTEQYSRWTDGGAHPGHCSVTVL